MIFESRLFFRNDRISRWKTHHCSSGFIENFWDSNLWKSNRIKTYCWSGGMGIIFGVLHVIEIKFFL